MERLKDGNIELYKLFVVIYKFLLSFFFNKIKGVLELL